MKIGIIGAGNIGTGIGKRLAAKGHDLVVSFARTPEALAEATALIGGNAKSATPQDAVTHGEVVIMATPWPVTLDLVKGLAGNLVGKIVWDCTNPFAPDMSELLIGTTTSAGEEIAKAAPGAQIVKAVPPFAQSLHSPNMLINGHRPGVFVCGGDTAARQTIIQLVDEIGADAVDSGPLKRARYTEPLGMLVTNLAYIDGMGPAVSAILVRQTRP